MIKVALNNLKNVRKYKLSIKRGGRKEEVKYSVMTC